MKKILLINSPVYDSQDGRIFLPLGISYLAAALRNNNFICDTLDGNLNSPSIDSIVKKALEYDLVGISANTINFANAVKIASFIKKQKNIPILLGGHYPTFEHDKIIYQYDCFDVIMRGEGEHNIVELCKDYFENNKFTKILDGVTYKCINGQTVLSNRIYLEKNIDSLPNPIRDRQGEYPRKKFPDTGEKLYVSISTSRGCPYGCIFCSVTNFRSVWEPRTPENVASEAYELYKKYKKIFITFADANFYIDPERSKKIISKINSKCGEIIGFSFAARADQIVRNGSGYLNFFKENGCYSIELGVENGSDSMLNRFCKRTTSMENKKAIEMIRQAGIFVAVDYILFDPMTSIDELKENISFMKDAKIYGYFPPLLYNRIKPYPGTQFSKKYGDIKDPYYFKDKNVYTIFNLICDYAEEFQIEINDIVTYLENLIQNSVASHSVKLDYIWLTMLPYELFESLINSDGDYERVYSIFRQKKDIKNRLNILKAKYSL